MRSSPADSCILTGYWQMLRYSFTKLAAGFLNLDYHTYSHSRGPPPPPPKIFKLIVRVRAKCEGGVCPNFAIWVTH